MYNTKLNQSEKCAYCILLSIGHCGEKSHGENNICDCQVSREREG